MDDGEWQSCNVETFSGADSSTLAIPVCRSPMKGITTVSSATVPVARLAILLN